MCHDFHFLDNLFEGPGQDHIFIWLGPTPPTPSSPLGLLVRTCVGTLLRLGTNVRILGQNYKYSSSHHFHYSQVN